MGIQSFPHILKSNSLKKKSCCLFLEYIQGTTTEVLASVISHRDNCLHTGLPASTQTHCVVCLQHSIQKLPFFFFFFFFFKSFKKGFGCTMWHAGSWFPDLGSNLCPLHWKCRVLTTILPGKSIFLGVFFFFWFPLTYKSNCICLLFEMLHHFRIFFKVKLLVSEVLVRPLCDQPLLLPWSSILVLPPY